MRIRAFVSDYHGTLEPFGRETERLLTAMRDAGIARILNTSADRERILGTGGITPEQARLFDIIVVENGAALWNPNTGEVMCLAPPPDAELAAEIARRGVPADAMWTGSSVIGVRAEFGSEARASFASVNIRRRIRGQEPLHAQLMENHGAVTINPLRFSKLSGARAALALLGITDMHGVVGAGDGIQDRTVLAACSRALVPSNAVRSLQALPNAILGLGPAGAGVIPLVRQMARHGFEIVPRAAVGADGLPSAPRGYALG